MFEKFKLAAQLGGMMKDLPKLRARVDEIKARLATTEVEAVVGGGAVQVRATCDLHITRVELAPSMIRGLASGSAADLQYANRLIAECVNAALDMARARLASELSDAAAEMNIPLPPEAVQGMIG